MDDSDRPVPGARGIEVSWQVEPLARSLGEWRTEWDALNHRLYGGHPFRDSGFVEALLKHFGRGEEKLCIHRTQERIDGMLIFRVGHLGVWRQFVPPQAQAAPVLLERRELLQSLFSVLSPTVWMLEFYCQDPQFSPEGLLREGVTTRVLPHALTMSVTLSGTFEAYWGSRSKNLTKNLRRYMRRVTETFGAPEMRVITDPAAMRDATLRYGKLESTGWKGQEGTAVHVENEQGAFYVDLLQTFAQTGHAEVVEYWLGGKLAASRLVIRGGDMAIILKTTYDESLAKYAPGRLLLQHYLERAFALQRKRTVEFYTDATPDQLAWATSQRQIFHLMVFRTPWLAQAYDVLRWIKRRSSAAQQTPASALQVDLVERFADLPPQALPLLEASERESFDLSADWFRLLEPTVASAGARPRYAVLAQGDDVQGLIPLAWQPGGWLRRLNSLTNFYTSFYRPLLSPSLNVDALGACIRAISRISTVDVWRFDAMDAVHPEFTLLESALRRAGFLSFRFFGFGNWYLPVEGRSFDAYFESLSSQVRNTVRRREKKFLAAGRGQLKIVTEATELEQAITAWREIYQASWKIPEPFPEFVPSLIRLCAERDWLRLGLAYYDDKAVAAQLWIVSHGRAVIYKLAYDEKFAKLSAGTVLTAHLMRHVLDSDRVHEVDYLIGDDNYKKDWMRHRRERWGLVAYNPKTLRGLLGVSAQAVGEWTRQLRMRISKQKERGAMNWTLYPIADFERHAVKWDGLNEIGPNSPLLRSHFLLASLRAFGSGTEMLALLGDHEHPDAMTVISKHRSGAWNTFQPAQAPIGFWLSRARVEIDAAMSALIAALPGFTLTIGVSQQDPVLLPQPKSLPKLLAFDYIDTAKIEITGTFDAYWEKRGKNLRQNMRKVHKRLEKDGLKLTLCCSTKAEEMRDVIEQYGRLESAGWKAQDGSAVHLDNAQGRFYVELLETYCRIGAGRVYSLLLNDAVVAMDLCVDQAGVLVILKTTYDEAYKDYSPAMLMHHELFQRLFQSKEFKRIEFYGKVMDWHLRWTDDVRTMYHLNAYRWTWLKRLMARRVGVKSAHNKSENV